jgi:serine/threonine protein kinase
METWADAGPRQLWCHALKFWLIAGRVRLAKNVNTGQLAAVKIVPKTATPTAKRKDDTKAKSDKTGTQGLSYSIEREVVIMKLIEHPNVMRLYDVWENRGEL